MDPRKQKNTVAVQTWTAAAGLQFDTSSVIINQRIMWLNSPNYCSQFTFEWSKWHQFCLFRKSDYEKTSAIPVISSKILLVEKMSAGKAIYQPSFSYLELQT